MEIDEKQIFSIIQKAKETGSIKIGVNEVTKAIERGLTKLVVSATDVSPSEIVAHFPGLCKEMKSLHTQTGSRAELGATVGIKTTTAIAIIDAGTAKSELETLIKASNEKDKKEKAESVKKEIKVEESVKKEVKEKETSKEEKSEEKSE